nr:protein trpE N term [Citrobacter freundii]
MKATFVLHGWWRTSMQTQKPTLELLACDAA